MPFEFNIIYLILPALFGIAIFSFIALYFEAKRLSFISTVIFSLAIFAASLYAAYSNINAVYLGSVHIYQ